VKWRASRLNAQNPYFESRLDAAPFGRFGDNPSG
jgi:hypothetical protein